jgi:hypothetical protein
MADSKEKFKQNFCQKKPEGKRPRGRYRCRFEDNIKFDLKEGCEYVNWMNLAEDSGGML